ncbi:energy-coupling factor ABC transporter ATP-binding protein [Pseudoroseicyclus tamaricis]|uniref:ABC transporter ATP-binding protein n=1 Tax=Pseudoroseicyclus tamaricis TaxID=2705421 RepID=A0A6B2JY41_9RHOB|nr:ABC transporter ATP-binding protein [Pseudoroseicyclus tamaricis]NDV00272.1 ABC transporter ATP-binding protein [Pseudoroseicyclus tamaricis]
MAPLFRVEGLTFAYPGRAPALEGIDLELHARERLFLTGANGSGKSTLLRCLIGLARPQAGRIIAFGEEPTTEEQFRRLRCRAGFVFQDPDDQLFSPTVIEDVAFGPLNMGLPRDEAIAQADEALAGLGLDGFRDRITYKLSGGERRLVSLATVLAMKPEVLLLDEPTNALDEVTTDRLADILTGLPQAMIAVSHDPHFRAEVGTREVFLHQGRIVAERPAGHGARRMGA